MSKILHGNLYKVLGTIVEIEKFLEIFFYFLGHKNNIGGLWKIQIFSGKIFRQFIWETVPNQTPKNREGWE